MDDFVRGASVFGQLLTSGRPEKRHFFSNSTGVAAVEFALVFPVLLLLWAGGLEISRALDASHKVELLARTVADLTAQGDQQNPMAASTMNDILATSTKLLPSRVAGNLKIVVSALGVASVNGSNQVSVCSSVAGTGATARTVGPATNVSLGSGYSAPGARLIYVEVSALYNPLFGSSLYTLASSTGQPFGFSERMTWPTRGGSTYVSSNKEVVLPNGNPCSQ